MKISLNVVTPEKIVFEDVVDSISLMTEQGEITILPEHIPLVSNLRSGEARIKKDGEMYFLAMSTGFVEVRGDNHVVILADTAERMEELDLDAIEKAKEQARKTLEEVRHVDTEAFAHAAAALERELARHKVAMRKRRR